MAPNMQVLLQAAVLCCVVTVTIGGITDFQKAFLELQNEVKAIKQQSQEEVRSLHLKIELLEKKLQPLQAKGEPTDSEFNSNQPSYLHVSLSFPIKFDQVHFYSQPLLAD